MLDKLDNLKVGILINRKYEGVKFSVSMGKILL